MKTPTSPQNSHYHRRRRINASRAENAISSMWHSNLAQQVRILKAKSTIIVKYVAAG